MRIKFDSICSSDLYGIATWSNCSHCVNDDTAAIAGAYHCKKHEGMIDIKFRLKLNTLNVHFAVIINLYQCKIWQKKLTFKFGLIFLQKLSNFLTKIVKILHKNKIFFCWRKKWNSKNVTTHHQTTTLLENLENLELLYLLITTHKYQNLVGENLSSQNKSKKISARKNFLIRKNSTKVSVLKENFPSRNNLNNCLKNLSRKFSKL